jgi:ribonuclease H2 subunit A
MPTMHLVLRGLSVSSLCLGRLLGPDLTIPSTLTHVLLSFYCLYSFSVATVAKVTRDRMNENWQFSEPLLEAKTNFGSGYPSDPTCKKWMEDNLSCNVFGFPDVTRFSWAPSKKALEKNGVPVTFEADVDEDDPQFIVGMKRQQDQMSAFLGKKETMVRYPFFERKRMEAVINL